ncbi:hypothetical protein HGI30_06185 [Paenibacillus albicereus]|uniref:Uncharacterized protein n=1 Tax=Paenibacillus albicereus TaxID=2726185 RepID=A0A6H2GUT9_9BACL|nr:hypothetical protein [Paenibacillus albicereus]QJC51191.1 hypothetical protein HGI30_06185 [Paenibacillus albicereus]
MMSIKYRNTCSDIEILVKHEESDAVAPYRVNIQSSKNPLSFGNNLASYDSEEQAVKTAEKLCGYYAAAKSNGYYMKGKAFTKPDCEDIEIADVLERDLNEDQFNSLLNRQSIEG